MPTNSLNDLYVHMLQDIWSANSQAGKATGDLAEEANDARLREALAARSNDLIEANRALAGLITAHGADPDDEHCKGMEGLAEEARAHGIRLDAPAAVKDASILAQYQRLAHYRIAAYGSAKALASELGLDDAEILEKHLSGAERADRVMCELADRRIHGKAA